MVTNILCALSDNWLRLSGMRNSRTNALVSSATVEVTVCTLDEVPVTGTAQPLIGTPVSGVPGAYDVIIPLELALELKRRYLIRVYVDAGGGLRRTVWLDAVCQRA